MSLHPQVKWAQRPDVVYLTVLLPDAKDPKVNLDPEGIFTFSATAGAGDRHYELKLELQDKVNVEESKISIGVRSIVCVLQKAEPKWWNKLLRGDAKAPHYVKVDWDKWVDEDDEADAGPGDMDMNSMDFSKFGDMGGMGGDMAGMMGGMGGMMGGMGGMMGGMGGMGGMMGGMGGDMAGMMGGMGGDMGDDLDDSDDEEQEVTKPSAKADEKVDEEPKGEGSKVADEAK
ncbi:uncharacterized protein OsI_027940 [Nicotiana tabacum]|uniref:Co-chaperone protein p23 n=1 Tax=Nicotiana tabacum TaxID=4097 RepID=A0A1S3ZK20_TOBAC|nr:uncharacterized protein OsI_027940 isoform X1 [Nicotiana tomentosiformis]XP_016464721.1 PREDICTED: uncharacterized protein OsI_027940-like isoform X1 [Nicotiana tabacum]